MITTVSLFVDFQVKWMMYWIVFALFIFFETFADIFISWLVAEFSSVCYSCRCL